MPATTVSGVALLSPKEPTVVQRVFRGTFCSVIQCTHCGSTSATVEPFLDVSLNMPGKDPWDVPVSKKRAMGGGSGGGAPKLSKKQEKKLRKKEEDRKRREEQLASLRAQVAEKPRSKRKKPQPGTPVATTGDGKRLTQKDLDAIPVKPTDQWLRSKKKMALVDWLMQYAPVDLLDQTLNAKSLHRTSPPKKIKKVFSEADLRSAVEDVWSTMQQRVRDAELAEKTEDNRQALMDGAIEKAVGDVVKDLLQRVDNALQKNAEDHGEGDGEAKEVDHPGAMDDSVVKDAGEATRTDRSASDEVVKVADEETVGEASGVRPEAEDRADDAGDAAVACPSHGDSAPPETESWQDEAERLLRKSRSAAPHLTHDGGYLHTLDAAIPPAVAAEVTESLSLEQCLADFTHEEVIPCGEGQGYRCEACLKALQGVWDARFRGTAEPGSGVPPRPAEAPRREAIKRFVFHQVPPVLVVHVKRFGQSAFGKIHKRSDALVLPERVSLDQFATSVAGGPDDKQYRLVGVVVHHGATMTSGHYIAHVRVRDQWACISDSSVRQSSVGQAARDQPYLAFYERVSE